MTSRPRPNIPCRLLLILSLAALVGTAVRPALAQVENVFEVGGIAVDVTAETAAAAREKAIAEGEARAVRMMLERLTLREDWSVIPSLRREEIAGIVSDFSVADEKTSAVRYLATLTVRFNADAVRRLLAELGLPFAETPSKPVLVLPVYRAAGVLSLWDEPNPWRDAWARRPERQTLVPTILPIGDLQDIATIGAEQAVAGDSARLRAIAARYGAGDTLVAEGVLSVDPRTGRNELEVLVTRDGSALQQQTVVKTFQAEPGETIDRLLSRAADELSYEVEDNWKRDNLLQLGAPEVAALNVPIDGLQDWLIVLRRLQSVAVVQRVDPVLIARDEVRVNVHYLGTLGQLELALEQADLSIRREGDEWILSQAGSAQGSAN